MDDNKQKLNELKTQFKKDILEEFKSWAAAEGVEPTNERFLNYVLSRSIIPDKQIIRFMTVLCYPRILKAEGGRKMRALYSLENIIPRKTTQLQTILKHYSSYFNFRKSILKHEKRI